MSDLMFYGVLRMPYEMAMGDVMSSMQFYSKAQEAADRVERAEAENVELHAALADAGRKNLELTRVHHERGLQIGRLDVALRRASVPVGWKLVPIELTDDMAVAFCETWFSAVRCIDDPEMDDAYAAMLAVAPAVPGDGDAS